MTQSTQKAHQLKNDFGELAEKVVDEIIKSNPTTLKKSLTMSNVITFMGCNKSYWKKVKNELKKIK